MVAITAARVRELRTTGHVVFAYPHKGIIVVDGFKRFKANQAALSAAAKIYPRLANETMGKEILVYGLARGETERYTEELLSTQCHNTAEVEALMVKASKDGWHSFRVAKFTPGEMPDFAKTVRV